MSSTNTKYKLLKGQEVIAIDKNYFRPTEVSLLVGASSKALEKLGWKPRFNLKNLIEEMMSSDLKLMEETKRK